jgi:hypothetical protein
MPSPPRQIPPQTPASIQLAIDAAIRELKAHATQLAEQQQHVLGSWRETGDSDVLVAFCRKCLRQVVIDGVREPHLSGPASSMDRCPRPDVDAFLATQHESVTR